MLKKIEDRWFNPAHVAAVYRRDGHVRILMTNGDTFTCDQWMSVDGVVKALNNVEDD